LQFVAALSEAAPFKRNRVIFILICLRLGLPYGCNAAQTYSKSFTKQKLPQLKRIASFYKKDLS